MVRRMLSPRMPAVDLAESGTPSLTDSAVIKYRGNIVSGSDMLDFEIGVYAANEALLGDCLRSVDRAYAGDRAGITVILNGTRDNSDGGGMGLDSVLIWVGFLVAMRCFCSSPIRAPQRDSSRHGSSGYRRIRLQFRKPLSPSPDADRSARCRSGRPGRAGSVRAALPAIPHHRVLPRIEETSA